MITARQITTESGGLYIGGLSVSERGHASVHVEGSHTETGEGKGNGGTSDAKREQSAIAATNRQRFITSLWPAPTEACR